ncbi:Uncharacterised protein [Mycobacteroides abscessus subsp. abscessus]|nr:Uncharacterised protein [Mycobacteroides abscessus subsp. abscessus]
MAVRAAESQFLPAASIQSRGYGKLAEAIKDVGRAVDAVLWLLGVAFLLFRLVSWLGYGFPDSFGDPSALGFVKSAVLILGFKGLVRRVLIVVLASPLILVHWLVRWVRRA